MNTQKLKEVFEKKIKPELGRIKKQEKYLRILMQLADNSSANKGKGIRAAEIIDDLQPVNHALNKLADAGFIEITLPIGDGRLIIDPINNKRELFKKSEMIEDYYSRFRLHLDKDSKAREIVKKVLLIKNDWQMQLWLDRLEEQENFDEYNLVVFKLLEKGIEIQKHFYGPLLWKRMAKYYNISDKTKNLLED